MEDPDAPILPKWARVNAKKARKEARRSQRKAAQEAEARGEPAPLAVNLEAAVSVAHRPLPPIPGNLAPNATTICLCYQYKEPMWTKKQHKHALNTITHLAREHQVTGRGRCAPEGLNATLTANAQNMRNFCYALRAWDPLFQETDFKLSDGEIPSALFRTFTLRKVDELVGYGLGGAKAPSLTRHAGVHLEAHEYHETMKSKDTVIIDVRNAYESAIGHFQPPKDGAQLLDPKMRNSTDFPKWLNAPETKEKLQGKTVMMYCTGGIRCERATALLNQMTQAEQGDDGFKTKDVVMVRGGIERYLKTFPEGGFWKGKNYLFDKRMEQVPILKTADDLQADVESECCLCSKPYSSYRGQFKCSIVECAVPVIVCHKCQKHATESPDTLVCPLCVDGYQAPQEVPDLVGQKRQIGDNDASVLDAASGDKKQKKEIKEPSRRIFVGRLPLLVTAITLRLALITAAGGGNDNDNDDQVKVEHVQWLVDRDTNAYYGSAFVQMSRLADAETIVKGERLVIHATELEAQKAARKAASGERWGTYKMRTIKTGRVRLAFAPLLEDEIWPPMNYKETEFPPR
jgi:predicted sulfurtransferase